MENSKNDIASQNSLEKISLYKDAAIFAINDSTAYDSTLMKSNEEYMEKLTKSDKEEYDILKLNMKKAESASERESIRKAMSDMRRERAIKDTENKMFYERQQQEHNENNWKILRTIFGVLVVGSSLGLGVHYGKPILAAGRKLVVKA